MTAIFDMGAFAPCPTPFNMAAHILARAEDAGDKLALSIVSGSQAQAVTYAELAARTRSIATGFQELGLQPGDRILLRLGNRLETPLAYLAAIAVDLIPVPTSAHLTEAETAQMIDTLDPALILHEAGVPCPNHSARRDVAILNDMASLRPCDFVYGDPNRAAYIVFTSGTSGTPRAVVHAHRAIWARQMMITDWYDLQASDRLLHAGAFNWTYTMGTGLMDPWSVGATALIPAPGVEIAELPTLLEKHNASIFAAAPGVYRKMLMSDRPLQVPNLRHGLSAGEALSHSLRNRWIAVTDRPVFEAFGMSECSTFISGAPDRPAKPPALGTPQRGRRVAILGANGEALAYDTPGTIAIHRDDPGLMLGYLDAPRETADRFSGDWFLTGDLGQMDPDGQITYLGRVDDMMNAGGYRVSPLEVEAAFAGLPGLEALAVTEVAAKADAQIIVAFYTGPTPLDTHLLETRATATLARYKQPRAYVHVPELPLGPNGKLKRKSLAAYWSPP